MNPPSGPLVSSNASANGSREEVRRRIESDDIEAKDLIVGGSIASTDDSQFLKQKGAMVCAGVKQAAEELKARIRSDLKPPDA